MKKTNIIRRCLPVLQIYCYRLSLNNFTPFLFSRKAPRSFPDDFTSDLILETCGFLFCQLSSIKYRLSGIHDVALMLPYGNGITSSYSFAEFLPVPLSDFDWRNLCHRWWTSGSSEDVVLVAHANVKKAMSLLILLCWGHAGVMLSTLFSMQRTTH